MRTLTSPLSVELNLSIFFFFAVDDDDDAMRTSKYFSLVYSFSTLMCPRMCVRGVCCWCVATLFTRARILHRICVCFVYIPNQPTSSGSEARLWCGWYDEAMAVHVCARIMMAFTFEHSRTGCYINKICKLYHTLYRYLAHFLYGSAKQI